MKNNGGTSTKGPAAEWDSNNTGDTSWYWNVIPSDGGYRISPAGDNQNWLYCIDDNNGLRVGTNSDTIWNLDEASRYLSCVDSGGNTRYMGIYDNNGGDTSVNPNFRTYKNTTGNTKDQTTTFYKLEGGSVTPPDPGEDPQPGESPIKAGDSVVFYMPAEKKVMTTTASGDKLTGQEGALEGNILTTDKTAAVFTVGTNEEGQFTFSADGEYLTSGERGDSLTMTETASAYSYWILEEQGEGWLVKNVSAQYNGGAQYIEYFNSGFTTYGLGSNLGIYTFQFFQAADVKEPGSTPEPEPGDDPIYDGERVVIYNPEYGKALSANYSGFYNQSTDVTLTGSTLTGFSASDVWTVIDNGDGTWSFSYGGQKIGMDTKYTSMPLGGVNDKWVLEDVGNGLYYVKNTVRNAYMEYQDDYGTWSAYNKIDSGSEGMFALAFYKVTDIPKPPSSEVEFPKESFVIYNISTGQYGHEGVLGGQDDNVESPSITDVAATVQDGSAVPGNGARVFTVEETADGYYRFKTADGYLSSNGTGNNGDSLQWRL